MIKFKVTYTNLTTKKEESKEIKTSSMLKMKPIINAIIVEHHIEDWTLTKYLPKIDRWGSNIETSGGNSGMNSGAYLSEWINGEDCIK